MASTGELPEDARIAKPAEDIHSLHLSRDSAYQSLGPVDLRRTLPEPDSVQDILDIDAETQFPLEFDYSFLQEPAANTEPTKFFESELHQNQFDESFYSDHTRIPLLEADDLVRKCHLNILFELSNTNGCRSLIPPSFNQPVLGFLSQSRCLRILSPARLILRGNTLLNQTSYKALPNRKTACRVRDI
jgi:hypothetical protein